MAMMISKFHRLIQSRLLWASFLIIVIFTFIVWGTTMPSTESQQDAQAAGTLNGEPVDQQTFRSAYMNSYLSVILALGRSFNITPQIDTQLREAAWQRIIAIDEAKKMGLNATDDEIAQAIQQQPIFQTEDKRFSLQGYKQFIGDFLSQLGINEKMFEGYIREEIILQKTRGILGQGLLVAPLDVRRTFSSVSDRFKIQYVTIGQSLVSNEVKVTEADVKAFFEKDPTAFTIPEKARVKFVRFSVVPQIPKAKVTPEEVEQYYNDNLDEFLKDTNTVAATTNLLETISRYKAREEVKQEISNKLIRDAAVDLTVDKALAFIDLLSDSRERTAISFEAAAEQSGVPVEEPEPFTQAEEVAKVDAGLEFNQAAFALSIDADSNFSEPVKGEDYVYVLALVEKIAPRVPTFDEVASRVRPYAEMQAISDALSAKAQAVRDAADAALKAGKTFADGVKSFDITPVTSEEFTASTGPTTNDYSEVLMRGIMTMNQGELSELLPADDAILIAFVETRTPGDPSSYDSLKEQIETTIRRQNTRIVYDEWQDYLLKQAKFEDRLPTNVPDEETPVEEEATL